MKIDILTLLIMLSIAYILQIAAVFLQYKINKTYKGLGFWTLGFLFFALGFATAPLRSIAALENTVVIQSNAFLVIGLMFIYAGLMRFFEKKEKLYFLVCILAFYVLFMWYFLLINNNLAIRIIFTSLVLALLLFMSSYALFFHKTKSVKASAVFNLAILFMFGCFFIFRAVVTYFTNDVGGYFSSSFIQVSVFMAAFVEGILITFGLIIMVNQRLNAEMKNAKDQKELIFNTSPDGALVTTLDNGVIIDSNEAFSRITGFSYEDTIGKSVTEINLWKNPDHRRKIISVLKDDGFCENIEVDLIRKDGKHIVGMFSARKVVLDKTMCVLSVTRDITDRKKEQHEKEILEAQNRQLQKAESLGLMAGAIAHHFNNQLQSVMGNLELAADGLSSKKESIENLDDALQSARKAADVSKMMLSYLGQVHSKYEPLNLSDICRNYLPLLEASKSKEIGLVTDFENPGPVISSNPNQIQQIITNIINNSIEAGSLGNESIRMTVKTVLSSEISPINRFPIEWLPDEKKYACIEVADSGSGIDEKDIERIFDPFFSKKFAGRGLGLSVVLGIIRTHNGAVTVESASGSGTVLRIFFPVAAADAISATVHDFVKGENKISGTILIVDDEPGIIKIASASVKRSGFSVLSAHDGIEAVETFKKNHESIVCVLLDLNMPRMNGWDALAAMRQINHRIPVILSSGYDESHAMAGKHNELPQAFLSKPYDLKSLNELIQKVLKQKK